MKHPLTATQRALRELRCWAVGHTTKCSWGRRKDCPRDKAIEHDSLPYGQRMRTGNGFCEYKAWWKYKCTVCRETYRDNAPLNSWHVRWYFYTRTFFRGFASGFRYSFEFGKGYRKVVGALPWAFLDGLQGAAVARKFDMDGMWWYVSLLLEANHRVSCWVCKDEY